MSPSRRPRIGDPLPPFSLPAATGGVVSSGDLLGRGPIVIYFYPKDETLGCTREVCAFRDVHADFGAAGAVILGISPDSIDSHKSFIDHHRVPFTLLSDPEERVFAQFGVRRDLFGFLRGRETFVADRAGILRAHIDSLFPGPHVRGALAAVRRLAPR